jgi:hypothetical protein
MRVCGRRTPRFIEMIPVYITFSQMGNFVKFCQISQQNPCYIVDEAGARLDHLA